MQKHVNKYSVIKWARYSLKKINNYYMRYRVTKGACKELLVWEKRLECKISIVGGKLNQFRSESTKETYN